MAKREAPPFLTPLRAPVQTRIFYRSTRRVTIGGIFKPSMGAWLMDFKMQMRPAEGKRAVPPFLTPLRAPVQTRIFYRSTRRVTIGGIFKPSMGS
jgi:hypothetical protein